MHEIFRKSALLTAILGLGACALPAGEAPREMPGEGGYGDAGIESASQGLRLPSAPYPGSEPNDGHIYPAPRNLRTTARTGTAITVEFSCAGNAPSQRAERRRAGGSWTRIRHAVPEIHGRCRFTDWSVVGDSRVCYRVQAVNATDSVTSSPLCFDTPPTAPEISAQATAERDIAIRIEDRSQREQGFVVELRRDGESFRPLTEIVYSGGTTGAGHRDRVVTHRNVQPNTRYTYRVYATHPDGRSAYATTTGSVFVGNTPSHPGAGTGATSPGGGNDGGSDGEDAPEAGLDCGCSKKGKFVSPVAPKSEDGVSPDGKYQVHASDTFLSVVTKNDGKRVFATPLTTRAEFGFGPRSRYFVLASRSPSNERVTVVTVHDLETGERIFRGQPEGSAGWGFSADGRTFVLSFAPNQRQSGLNLVNLATGVRETMFMPAPFSSANLFSPCGDVFALVYAPTALNSQSVRLYRTRDFEEVAFITTDSMDKLVATATEHHVERFNKPSATVADNEAAPACEPSRASTGRGDRVELLVEGSPAFLYGGHAARQQLF